MKKIFTLIAMALLCSYNAMAEENPCMKIVTPGASANAWDYQIDYPLTTPLENGAKYTLKMRSKASSDVSIGFWPYKNGNGGATLYTGTGTTRTDWTDGVCNFTANDDLDHIRFVFGTFGGEIYMDDVTLTKEGSDENLIGNSTFSENCNGWVKTGNIHYGRLVSETPRPDSFDAYLKVTTPAPQANAWDWCVTYKLSEALVPEGKYTLVLKSKTSEDFDCGFCPSGDGKTLYSGFKSTTDWGTRIVAFTANGPLTDITINFGKLGGNICLDDVCLYPDGTFDNLIGNSYFDDDLAGWEKPSWHASALERVYIGKFDPVVLYSTTVTPLSNLTGTDAGWASRIIYPATFQSQGTCFGDGDGSNESTHVNIDAYDKLYFSVSSPSDKGLALRLWIWDDVKRKVVTLYAHPDADFATADFTQEYEIKEAGIYSVDIRGYKYLKGIKAANKYEGQTPLVVDYASVATIGQSFAAVDEARTFSSNKILDFSEVADVEAYIATAVADGKVTMKKVEGAVPANTGLVLKQVNDKAVISIPTCGEATVNTDGNLLVATTEATNVPTGAYVLAGTGASLGWYYIGSTAANLAAGKAYLAAPVAGKKMLEFAWGDDNTTAADTVAEAKVVADKAFYTVAGVKVAQPKKGNLYIYNGKAIVF